MRFAYASALLLPIVARAAYPDELAWSSNAATLESTLEFCHDGSNYGYRAVGDTSACGSKPGPLIRMTPGQTYTLTLQNTASSTSVITNIHTHGLHIVGDGDSDNVLRSVEGGSCLQYTYKIPSDHPGGTYWYHPHYHTQTNAQTSGGAFGMIIIEEPSSTSSLTSWATDSGNEKLLQISNAGSLLGNGNSNEVLEFEANRWYRLRVSVVVPGARPSDIKFDSSCTVYKVASDGVWHNAEFDTYAGSSFELTGASRADFAIKCQNGLHAIKWGQGTAATIEAGLLDSGTGMDGDDLGSPPQKPDSLDTDLIENTVTPATTTSISLSGAKINGATWNEDGPGLGDIPYGKVHEWTISGSGAHPFHLHLYHMLVIDGCGAHQAGEFYDTISATGSCTVRFRTWDFGQKMIMHCHVLQHEDNGAINFMNVVEADVPIPLTNTKDVASYTCSSGNPPSTTLPPTTTPTTAPTTAPTLKPTSPPTKSPNLSTTTAPPTTSPTLKPTSLSTNASQCIPSGSACPNGNSDCCSGNCNGIGTCRGNVRYLRASSVE